MLTSATWAEVVDNNSCSAELAGGVRPNIRTVGFLRARSEHLYRCFVRMHDLLPDHHVTQSINQWLQLDRRREHYVPAQ